MIRVHAFTASLAIVACCVIAPASNAADTLDDLLDVDTPKQPVPDKPATDKPDGVADETPEDIFAAAVTEMKQAGTRLDGSDASLPTQRLQDNVILRIDQLIADARKKQCKNCKGGGQPKPGDSGSKPTAGPPKQGSGQPNGQGNQAAQQAGGPGAVSNRGDTEPLDEQFSEWGNLPDRIRKELLQGRDDRFSTLYDKLTQRYYKRLAEETP